MFHAYLRNKFSIVRLLNRPDKNQDYKVADFLRKNQRLNQLFYFGNAKPYGCISRYLCIDVGILKVSDSFQQLVSEADSVAVGFKHDTVESVGNDEYRKR